MKTAIITGAAGNMGSAVVRRFLDEGYRVIGTFAPGDDTTVHQSDAFEAHVADISDETAAGELIGSVINTHRTIDAAVLTVGGFAMGDISKTKTSDIFRQYQLNFETAYNIARPVFLQMMQQQQGRIFLVGSRPGLDAKSSKGMIAYSLAKSLIFRLAELMNEEAKDTNVVTSVIVPSTIDTPQNRKSMPSSDFSKWVTPEDIAGIIYYYSSDAAKTIREPVIKIFNKA